MFKTQSQRPLCVVSYAIQNVWRRPPPLVRRYLHLMERYNDCVYAMHYTEALRAQHVITMFLDASEAWKGPEARVLKAELRAMLPKPKVEDLT